MGLQYDPIRRSDMRSMFKFALWSAFLLFIGLPALFLLFVFGMAALGIALGIGGAIIALMFTVLKLALLVIIPVAIVIWVAKKLFAPERSY